MLAKLAFLVGGAGASGHSRAMPAGWVQTRALVPLPLAGAAR